jgi:hypothetical protein
MTEKFAAYRASCIGSVVARGLVLMRRSRVGGTVVSTALLGAGSFSGATSLVTERVAYLGAKIEVERIRDGEGVSWTVA